MNGGDLIKWGVIGLAGWWVYETFFATAAATPVATSTSSADAAAAAAAATAAAAAQAAAAAVAAGDSLVGSPAYSPSVTKALDAVYQTMVIFAKGANDPAVTSNSDGTLSATGDVWSYYLYLVNPSLKNGATNAAVGNTVYTSAQYWAVVGPGVAAQLGLNLTANGLSGLGLAGLGAVVMRGRR